VPGAIARANGRRELGTVRIRSFQPAEFAPLPVPTLVMKKLIGAGLSCAAMMAATDNPIAVTTSILVNMTVSFAGA
jgi:hypothetical protein